MGTPRSTHLSVVLALIASGCTQIVPAPPPPDAPRIQRFEASAQVISANERVQLSFTVAGATHVSLVDDSGQALQLEGTVEEGSAQVNPGQTTFYVLRASGPGGVVSAFLQVAVNEPLREAFLLAVPPVIEAGGHAQLLWSAPGARTVTLTERGLAAMTLSGSSGVLPISPSVSTGYHLVAQGAAGTPAVDALVEVRVRPAITSFDFTTTQGVRPGEPMTFAWTTRAATRLIISERSLGQILEVTDPDELAEGSFPFVVPSMLPGGAEITDGFPFHFTVTASSGADQASRELEAAVGNHPMFASVTAPSVVTTGGRFTLAWRTFFTSSVRVELGGQTIFETPSADRAVNGSVTLPAPAAAADYVLVASNERGQSARRTLRIGLVPGPVITDFTVPSALASPGAQSMASWETTGADRVTLRLDQGPALARVTAAASVQSGSAPFALASSTYLTLEAANAAGDVVRETRLVNVSGSSVSVSPLPALRSFTGSATLEWQLSALGVTSIVGLPTTAADGGVASWVDPTAFVDLSTSPTATTLQFMDPGEGSELLPRTPDFEFSLVGRLQPELWVSANGFIAFERPEALNTNLDFELPTVNAPTMLAPFWDDLFIPGTGSVLYELQNLPGGERALIVQWNQVRQQGVPASELTFQVQLFETGRVVFAYQTLTGASTGFTAGVNVVGEDVHQRFAFDSTGGPVSPGTVLDFFSGGPANGAREVATSSTRSIHFFGRAPSGLIPVSAEVRVVGVGDLAVSEAMPFPDLSALNFGQWVEVRNVTTTPVQLEGLKLMVESSPDGGTVLPRQLLQPGEFLMLGQSTDPLETFGVPVTRLMNDSLGTADSVRLVVDGSPVASLAWDGGIRGDSVFAPEGILVSDGVSLSCPRTRTFGPDGGAHGTPGAVNEGCAPYVMSRVLADYVEPGVSAVEVLESSNSFTGFGSFLLPVAFTYFGQSYTTVSASLGGGFLSFGPGLTSAFSDNPTTPATYFPNGVVAPFWDQIARHSLPEGDGALRMQRLPGRTIITWQDFYIAGDTSSHLNFQVHLVDPDIIEFHYGSMVTAGIALSQQAPTHGSSATVWIEDPQGTLAVPFSVNEQRISPFMSGVRFTPAP